MAPETEKHLPAYDKQGSRWLLTVHEGDGGSMTVRISDKSKNGINPDWPAPYPIAELPIEDFAAYMEPETFWRDHGHALGLHGLNPGLPDGFDDSVGRKDIRSMRAWASETLSRYRQMNQENKQKGDIQMDTQNQPKERIIFDGDAYDEDYLRDYLRDDYELYKDELEVTFDEFVEHRMEEGALDDLNQQDYDEEMGDLIAFFDGGERMMSSSGNPLAGNPVIVSGTVGRWDGEHRGYSPFGSLKDALDTSPSRIGLGNPLADCEIQKVWDENGHLFVHGAHHDGSVTVEVRQLTDDGAAALTAIEDAWVGEPFTAGGKSYDGSMPSINQAMRDLWGNPSLAPLPRYMEQSFGCPAEEWVQPRAVEMKTPEVAAGRSVGKATASVSLSDAAKESRAASQALAGDGNHDDRVQDAR